MMNNESSNHMNAANEFSSLSCALQRHLLSTVGYNGYVHEFCESGQNQNLLYIIIIFTSHWVHIFISRAFVFFVFVLKTGYVL